MKPESLRISIIQSELHWENIDKNLKMFSEKIASLPDTDLIVLPEMFNTGFSMNTKALAEHNRGKTMQWMRDRGKEKNCVITGSIIFAESGNYFNRLIWMRPDGTFDTYDKRHLFHMSDEDKYFSSGKYRLITELKGWKICPLICYDLRFPVWSRNKFSNKDGLKKTCDASYDLLIYIANWPERRAHPWKSLLVARAIENQAFVVGVNRVGEDGHKVYHSGDSAVFNFRGELLSTVKSGEDNNETITINYSELNEFRKTFAVGLDADDFRVSS